MRLARLKMADLLLELLSEEIPARMQAGAATELERLVVEARRLGLDEDRILNAVRKHWSKFPKKP